MHASTHVCCSTLTSVTSDTAPMTTQQVGHQTPQPPMHATNAELSPHCQLIPHRGQSNPSPAHRNDKTNNQQTQQSLPRPRSQRPSTHKICSSSLLSCSGRVAGPSSTTSQPTHFPQHKAAGPQLLDQPTEAQPAHNQHSALLQNKQLLRASSTQDGILQGLQLLFVDGALLSQLLGHKEGQLLQPEHLRSHRHKLCLALPHPDIL